MLTQARLKASHHLSEMFLRRSINIIHEEIHRCCLGTYIFLNENMDDTDFAPSFNHPIVTCLLHPSMTAVRPACACRCAQRIPGREFLKINHGFTLYFLQSTDIATDLLNLASKP
jgi:hypothetical protein